MFKYLKRTLPFVLSSFYVASPAIAQTAAQLGFVNDATEERPDNINEIRYQAIKEVATSLGAQGGLAWQAVRINNSLRHQSTLLDATFNFTPFLIDNKILPPILEEGSQSTQISQSGESIHIAEKSYRIISHARFVSTPPTWQSYLWMNYAKPDMPDKTLLPKTEDEVNVWNFYFSKSWPYGVRQANDIFTTNLASLKRDIKGMIVYNELLAQHLVNPPHLSQTDVGLTGDKNSLQIGNQVLKITQFAAMQPNQKMWTPIVTRLAGQQS